MAGRGPAPQPEDKVRRTNNKGRTVSLTPDGELRGPPLPRDMEWHARTKSWWSNWRKSAQAQTFSDSDWDFLLDTALMHNAMWKQGQWTLAAEVRLRVAKFGATPEDRLRLKMEISTSEPEEEAPAGTASMADYRSRLKGGA